MKVFVVDRDHRRRADLSFRLSGRGIYAAPHDPSDPFTAPRGELALLACHDPAEGRDEALAFLHRFGASSLLIFYSDEVVLPNVVAAMQRGALSYFQWPDDVDELIELQVMLLEPIAECQARSDRGGCRMTGSSDRMRRMMSGAGVEILDCV